MINKSEHPVAWAPLLYEIDDVSEHLANLVSQMSTAGRIDEQDFEVQIRHAYAHLNRIWNSRNTGNTELTDEQRDKFSAFPTDIEPLA